MKPASSSSRGGERTTRPSHFLVAPHVIASSDLLLTMAERVAEVVAKRIVHWRDYRVRSPRGWR